MGWSGGKSKEQKNEDYLRGLIEADRTARSTAVATAAAPNEWETRIGTQAKALDDWEHSIGPDGKAAPIDIHNMPGGGAKIALFNEANNMTDAGRVGRGTASMTDGANPNFVKSLDAEFQNERKTAAQGQLENSVNQALYAKDAVMGNLSDVGNQRNMQIAGMEQDQGNSDSNRWLTYLMRPPKDSFLRTLKHSFASSLGKSLGSGPPTPVPAP